MRLSVNEYPPGNYKMVPTGTHSDILKAPGELHPGPLYKLIQDPIGSRQSPVRGGRVPCVLSIKNVSVSQADPDRGPADPLPDGLDPWYISRRGPGHLVRIKSKPGTVRGEKMDGTRSGSLRVPCGTAKKRSLPGKAPL